MKYIWHTDFINCGWRRHARLDCRAKVRRKAVICKPRSAIIDHCNFIFPITPSKSAYSHIARALREKRRRGSVLTGPGCFSHRRSVETHRKRKPQNAGLYSKNGEQSIRTRALSDICRKPLSQEHKKSTNNLFALCSL